MSKDSKARKTKGKVLLFNPTGEYYFAKGLKAYHKRDLYKAKKYLQRAMQLEPDEPMIVCQLAVICSEMGDYQHANSLLHKILEELDEDMVECHYFLANNYAYLGFFKDAYHHANLYLELDEDGEFADETIDLLDLLTIEAEEMDEELYEQDDLITKQEQARELLESGHFPKAVEILNSVIDEYPEYWSAYNNLALAYFYLGEVQKAADILEKVFEENPGNLHALCNKLVFAFYERDYKEVKALKEVLKKINPLLIEHQFKLGATFALIGEYEAAFTWLRKLQKKGFDGDGAFYYWLSYAAYYTGREKIAQSAWEKAVEYNPDKAGFEPWNEEKTTINGFENHNASILKKLDSDHIEERLFALFLTAMSDGKEDILASKEMNQNIKFSHLEREYLASIRKGHEQSVPVHDIAAILYNTYHPIGTVEAGLFLLWFAIFVEAVNQNQPIKNNEAWAAAVEYTWLKLRQGKISQQEIADKYGISTSTLSKYVKLLKALPSS
ncbi:tetratricopeptide repeat protein [Bacillus sp. S/N-304-OC-R1]|uniref:tetratricopeptide repeat protein n=1 Tax=Bacillus sp. S/N-304-OC-R1 TaxID=2758034 RepID=UPI001C8E2D70|nr:tetratricopeptide repeat protein [Bacillus sp. S/N-304-OC-R1]MBY0123841.1 tetratricopeptide repeat protein [Bacillus sp. S/N-304-OC-R1]